MSPPSTYAKPPFARVNHYFVSFADGRHDDSEAVIFCVKCGETRPLTVAEKAVA